MTNASDGQISVSAYEEANRVVLRFDDNGPGMTRQQIVDTSYEAMIRLTRLKEKHGVISRELAEAEIEHPLGRDRVEVLVAVGVLDPHAIAVDQAHVNVAHALDHMGVGFLSQSLGCSVRITLGAFVVHRSSLSRPGAELLDAGPLDATRFSCP